MPNQPGKTPPSAVSAFIDLGEVEARVLAMLSQAEDPSQFIEPGKTVDTLLPYQKTFVEFMARQCASGHTATLPLSRGKSWLVSTDMPESCSGTRIRSVTLDSIQQSFDMQWLVSNPNRTPMPTEIWDCEPSEFARLVAEHCPLKPSVLPSQHRVCPAPPAVDVTVHLERAIPLLPPSTEPRPSDLSPWYKSDPWDNYLRSSS